MATTWTVSDMPALNGRRFFVTGANSGIGYWASVELARHGATVVMACRDAVRGRAALDRLQKAVPSAALELVLLNLASLESVQRVAETERARGLPLAGLINNAGVMAPPKRLETTDGFELQFGTNVLGHFALTNRLMPALEAADHARVVTIASIAHKRGKLNFDDLQSERSYNPMRAYEQSKLADLMFSFELERLLRAKSMRTMSNAAHPGVAETSLFKVGSGKGLAGTLERALQRGIGIFLNSETAGALPTLFAATAAEAQGGGYYGPQGFQEMRGNDVGPAKVMPQARDQAAQQRLWQICEELTGTSF